MKTLISKREQEVLQLISHEYSTKEIASLLYICYETAHSHRKNLLKKLNAKNAAGLIRRAYESGHLSLNNSGLIIDGHLMNQTQLSRAI